MKKTLMNLDDFDQIPEEHVRQMTATDVKESHIHNLLKIADDWKAANCTPVFIVTRNTDDHMMIACVSRESFGQWLN